jgi:hypothetical protein
LITSLVTGAGSAKSPLQVFLVDFLETFITQNMADKSTSTEDEMEIDEGINSNDTIQVRSINKNTIQNVARLFGELQRCGIFSHDSYVRYPTERK